MPQFRNFARSILAQFYQQESTRTRRSDSTAILHSGSGRSDSRFTALDHRQMSQRLHMLFATWHESRIIFRLPMQSRAQQPDGRIKGTDVRYFDSCGPL